jgi:hypothetical protein
MNLNQVSDKRHHRIVTLISLLVGLSIYFAARFGLFGEGLESFAPYYLAAILLILGVRAVFTELGVRRNRGGIGRRLQN